MPIKGMSDRNLAFPEIGQIRKGAPKPADGRKPGADLQYFRVTFDEKETEAIETFTKVYGDKPDEIRVILPFNEIEKMWEAWLEAYTAGRLVARSDGEYFVYLVDTKTGEVLVKNGMDKTGNKRQYTDAQAVGKDFKGNDIKCRPVGRLKIIVPELARAAYMTVLTTSINDIVNISQQLAAFQELNNGQIAGIPFVLRRRPKKISRPGENGQRVRVEKWLLSIEADPEWVRAKLTQVKRLALPGNGLSHDEDVVESTVVETDEEWDAPVEGLEETTPVEEVAPPEPEPQDDMQYPDDEPEIAPEVAPEPETPEIPKEVLEAMDMTDKDGKRYESYAVFDLNRRLKLLKEAAKVESDLKKTATYQKHIDALNTLIAYRKAEFDKKEALPQ
jgi:hypothetical protein